MSFDAEDETELRDLVTASLQTSGVLGKIKAQLRSNVYLAIEGDSELKKKSRHVNQKLDKFSATSEGRLALQLIRELLVFFGLDYTLMVFEPEALEGRNVTTRDRDKLVENLGFPDTLNEESPLMSEVIRLSKVSILKSETPTPTSESNKFPFRNEEDELSVEESDRSSLSAKTPQHQRDDFTSAAPTNKPEKDFNSTYSLNSSKPEELTKSFLGDLPPLGASSGPKNSSLSLAPLKRIPPVAKVEATKKEEPKLKPTVEVKPNTSANKSPSDNDPPSASSVTEDIIDEDLDEFLNSSISASEDFTKEETVTDDSGSLKADYVEKL